MMHVVSSAKSLRLWLTTEGLSQEWLANSLGTTQPTVYRWVTGEFRPDIHFRRAIACLSKGEVPLDGWFHPEELQIATMYEDEEKRREALDSATRRSRKE
jgi:transcriptional regulator with XRE-family HTH domain